MNGGYARGYHSLIPTEPLQELDRRLHRPLGIVHPLLRICPGHLGAGDPQGYRLIAFKRQIHQLSGCMIDHNFIMGGLSLYHTTQADDTVKILIFSHPLPSESDLKGSRHMPDNYIIVGHTDLRRDFEECDGFVSVVNYGSYTPVSEYEIGAVDGHRVILTNHFSKVTSGGSATTNGMEYTGSNVDVYPFVMFGEDAFTSIAVKGDNAGRPYAQAPKPGIGDELGQRGFISWKYYFGSKILNENWLIRGEAAVTAL